jgi:uncharacterized protein YegP (UPF0339 family)
VATRELRGLVRALMRDGGGVDVEIVRARWRPGVKQMAVGTSSKPRTPQKPARRGHVVYSEIVRDRAGRFRFRLRARNGEIVCQGESHPSATHARRAWRTVQRLAGGAVEFRELWRRVR